MIRPLMIAALSVTLAACQPKTAAPAETETPVAEAASEVEVAADAKPWLLVYGLEEVFVSSRESPERQPFRLACAKNGVMTASADVEEVNFSNLAYPYAIVASGESFPADFVASSNNQPSFEVSAPVTPELLKAIRDTQTARIMVNDGYAFAESAVDNERMFGGFVIACAALTGITPTP